MNGAEWLRTYISTLQLSFSHLKDEMFEATILAVAILTITLQEIVIKNGTDLNFKYVFESPNDLSSSQRQLKTILTKVIT